VTRAIVVENKWRAQRYGIHGTFVSEHGAVQVADAVTQVVDDVMPDAEALGCAQELDRCRAIVGSGTSADAQLAVFDSLAKSADRDSALQAVTDWLAAATLQ
jgi:carboxylate-amine ligase